MPLHLGGVDPVFFYDPRGVKATAFESAYRSWLGSATAAAPPQATAGVSAPGYSLR